MFRNFSKIKNLIMNQIVILENVINSFYKSVLSFNLLKFVEDYTTNEDRGIVQIPRQNCV